jgi:hypothetical protein
MLQRGNFPSGPVAVIGQRVCDVNKYISPYTYAYDQLRGTESANFDVNKITTCVLIFDRRITYHWKNNAD